MSMQPNPMARPRCNGRCIETMPTSFLIDRNGVIRYVHHGFRKGDTTPLRERIAQLIGASAPPAAAVKKPAPPAALKK